LACAEKRAFYAFPAESEALANKYHGILDSVWILCRPANRPPPWIGRLSRKRRLSLRRKFTPKHRQINQL